MTPPTSRVVFVPEFTKDLGLSARSSGIASLSSEQDGITTKRAARRRAKMQRAEVRAQTRG